MHQTNCAINLAYQSLAINLRYTRLACLCPCPFQSHYYSRCQKSLYVYKRTLQKKGRSEFRGDAFVTLVTLDWTPAIIGVAARRADHSSASWNSRSRTAATGGITLLSSGTGPPASPRLLPVADCFYRRHNKNNQLITPVTGFLSPLTTITFRAPDRRASSYPHKAELTCASSCTRPILCIPAPRSSHKTAQAY